MTKKPQKTPPHQKIKNKPSILVHIQLIDFKYGTLGEKEIHKFKLG